MPSWCVCYIWFDKSRCEVYNFLHKFPLLHTWSFSSFKGQSSKNRTDMVDIRFLKGRRATHYHHANPSWGILRISLHQLTTISANSKTIYLYILTNLTSGKLQCLACPAFCRFDKNQYNNERLEMGTIVKYPSPF